MTDWKVRPITEDEIPAWRALPYRNFHVSDLPSEADLDILKPRYAEQNLTAAYDADRIVGTFRTWDVDLPVPGGTVKTDAVSSVGVLPTHRRRGVLTAMIVRTGRCPRSWLRIVHPDRLRGLDLRALRVRRCH